MNENSRVASAATTCRARTRARADQRGHRFAPPLRGDEGQLLRRHAARLERSVAGMAPWASDWLIEEGCGHAWEQLIRYQPDRTTLFAWLRKVAYHEVLRLQRRKAKERSLEAKLSQTDEGLGGSDVLDRLPALADRLDADTAIEAREALKLLAGLPLRRRRALELQIAGYSYQEIAKRRGVTYTNVNRQVTEGRAELRRLREAVNDSPGRAQPVVRPFNP